jgi:large subunit ribosomal protein L24
MAETDQTAKAQAQQKADKKAAQAKAQQAKAQSAGKGPKKPRERSDYVARLKTRYEQDIRPQLIKERGYSNPFQAPKLTKIVLTGRDKGRAGEVIEMRPAEERAMVRGINMVKRHQRQTAQQEGGIISKEGSVHLSNLALADPKDGKPTRVGFKFVGEGDARRKVRVAKRSGVEIDG